MPRPLNHLCMSVSISLSFIHLSFHGMYGPSTFPKELGNSRGTLSVQNREERGRGLVKKKKTSQKTWQEHCKPPPPHPGTSKNHVLKGSKEIPCRHHSGFAPHQPRQHLNTCCAHGHKAKLPVQACPSSSLLVCVELKRKKNLFGITQNSWENFSSHTPLSSGTSFHLLSTNT